MKALRSIACSVAMVVAALSMEGCTVVHVQNADGSASVTRRFGFISIEPGPHTSLLRVTSVGAYVAHGNLSVGYGTTEAMTMDPHACQVVMWRPDADAARTLAQLLGPDHKICAAAEP